MKTETLDKPRFVGFGDESESNNAVTYGLVIIRERQRQRAESILAETKVSFGGSPHANLHCREIFAGDARRKSPWSHLSKTDVFELYRQLCNTIAGANFGRIIGFADTRDIPRNLPGDDKFPALKFGKKQIAAFCASAALIPVRRHTALDAFDLWVDPDRTKIDWIGRKVQAHRAISVWIADDTKESAKITPQPVVGEKPALLQLADMLAYISARALSVEVRKDKDVFLDMYTKMNPAVIRFMRGSDGGLGIRAPNFHPGFNILLGESSSDGSAC